MENTQITLNTTSHTGYTYLAVRISSSVQSLSGGDLYTQGRCMYRPPPANIVRNRVSGGALISLHIPPGGDF